MISALISKIQEIETERQKDKTNVENMGESFTEKGLFKVCQAFLYFELKVNDIPLSEGADTKRVGSPQQMSVPRFKPKVGTPDYYPLQQNSS